MWNPKDSERDTNEFTSKIERDNRLGKKNLWLPKGKEGQGKMDKLGGWN